MKQLPEKLKISLLLNLILQIWHDVVNNPEIDVVDICTPNNVHAEIAIAGCKGRKTILSVKNHWH